MGDLYRCQRVRKECGDCRHATPHEWTVQCRGACRMLADLWAREVKHCDNCGFSDTCKTYRQGVRVDLLTIPEHCLRYMKKIIFNNRCVRQ